CAAATRPASRSGRSAPTGGASPWSAPSPDTAAAGGRSFDDERDLVHVAPAPVLAGLGGAGDRVRVLSRVPGRVPVRRRVAATDLPAGLAHPQMEPTVAGLQAFLAACDG